MVYVMPSTHQTRENVDCSFHHFHLLRTDFVFLNRTQNLQQQNKSTGLRQRTSSCSILAQVFYLMPNLFSCQILYCRWILCQTLIFKASLAGLPPALEKLQIMGSSLTKSWGLLGPLNLFTHRGSSVCSCVRYPFSIYVYFNNHRGTMGPNVRLCFSASTYTNVWATLFGGKTQNSLWEDKKTQH